MKILILLTLSLGGMNSYAQPQSCKVYFNPADSFDDLNFFGHEKFLTQVRKLLKPKNLHLARIPLELFDPKEKHSPYTFSYTFDHLRGGEVVLYLHLKKDKTATPGARIDMETTSSEAIEGNIALDAQPKAAKILIKKALLEFKQALADFPKCKRSH